MLSLKMINQLLKSNKYFTYKLILYFSNHKFNYDYSTNSKYVADYLADYYVYRTNFESY